LPATASRLPASRPNGGRAHTSWDGFPVALGHGVGLELHEDPGLGRTGGPLLAGDVVTVEPFLCRPGFGGVQVEDMVLVTDDGAERLSNAP
jgi:Xaa-Pro aminopeptidase